MNPPATHVSERIPMNKPDPPTFCHACTFRLGFLLTWMLLGMPFLAVEIAPIIDLPQQMAQLRLAFEELGRPDSPYLLQWWTPNKLGYLPFALLWPFLSPWKAALLGSWLMCGFWLFGVFRLAWIFERPLHLALLAAPLLYSPLLQYGFFNFMAGFPLLVLWWEVVRREQGIAPLWLGLLGLLLYFAHVLWLGMGLLLLMGHLLVHRAPGAVWRRCGLALLPVGGMTAVWAGTFFGGAFGAAPSRWLVPLGSRLSRPDYWSEGLYSGTRGEEGVLLLAIMVLFAGVGAWLNREDEEWRGEIRLVLAGVVVLGLVMLLPDMSSNTLLFNRRWLPVAGVLLLLGLPGAGWRIGNVLALALVAAAGYVTASAWTVVEAKELSGLKAAVEVIPSRSRVLGLDHVSPSGVLKVRRPFLQQFAWSQALKGGELNFSFADLATSPVIYRQPREARWTTGLEWFPERVTAGDYAAFDYVLIGGDERVHQKMVRQPGLEGVTHEGVWRSYRVTR
ncbi:MAG: hypothetical protein HQL56_05880 [Magnetococcales bacterium]|nr:hypothetical protein [Magnetococcales bacterium]